MTVLREGRRKSARKRKSRKFFLSPLGRVLGHHHHHLPASPSPSPSSSAPHHQQHHQHGGRGRGTKVYFFDSKTRPDETSLCMWVARQNAGYLVGFRGGTINHMKEASGAYMGFEPHCFGEDDFPQHMCRLIIRGTQDQVERAETLARECLSCRPPRDYLTPEAESEDLPLSSRPQGSLDSAEPRAPQPPVPEILETGVASGVPWKVVRCPNPGCRREIMFSIRQFKGREIMVVEGRLCRREIMLPHRWRCPFCELRSPKSIGELEIICSRAFKF